MRESRPARWVAIGVFVCVAVATLWVWRERSDRGEPVLDQKLSVLTRAVVELERREREAAESIWADEQQAEAHGQVLEVLWDALNAATNRFQVLQSFSFGQFAVPRMTRGRELGHGVTVFQQDGEAGLWGSADWTAFLTQTAMAGWRISATEFRHIQFDAERADRPARSRFYFSAHLTNAIRPARAILEGDLRVEWARAGAGGGPVMQRVATERLSLRERAGAPFFREVFRQSLVPAEGSFFIDPLISYDLDGDGSSEILLVAKNLVYRRSAAGSYEGEPLCRVSPGLIFTGTVADFDDDGAADLLCARFEGLQLYRGSGKGSFEEPGEMVWQAQPHLRYAQAIACGDIDGDGDLDVWIGQYKPPYSRGQMPSPFYDANDGYPSYLLLNDGQGHFTDATNGSGLEAKRRRRVYGASFREITGDGRLDLVVASDFAGLELFANEGNGHFREITERLRPDWHGFGMSQLAADFNRDGQMDLLMVGMNVPVAERLIHLGRARSGFEAYLAKTASMTYGNRLYLGQPNGEFTQTELSEGVARSGWSWGCAAPDFDNDGYPDLSIVNGHETKQSVRDYETEFWLHDIYVGTSRDDLTAFAYFQSKAARTRGKGMSYGGYEKNRFYWNQEGREFVELAHLAGLALEADSRNVVADDLDGDGRLDLIVTTFEVWPEVRQTLRIFRNEVTGAGHWIAVVLREEGRGVSPVGAQVTLQAAGGRTLQQLVLGEGYRSQGPPTAHFGLGAGTAVEFVEVRWPDGRVQRLEHPQVDRSYRVSSRR